MGPDVEPQVSKGRRSKRGPQGAGVRPLSTVTAPKAGSQAPRREALAGRRRERLLARQVADLPPSTGTYTAGTRRVLLGWTGPRC